MNHSLDDMIPKSEKVLHNVIDRLQEKSIAMQINRNEWKQIAETQGNLHAEYLTRNAKYWLEARQAHCLGQDRRLCDIIDSAITGEEVA